MYMHQTWHQLVLIHRNHNEHCNHLDTQTIKPVKEMVSSIRYWIPVIQAQYMFGKDKTDTPFLPISYHGPQILWCHKARV